MSQGRVAIVIPALDDADELARTLMAMPREGVEIVVVDGGSRDRTVDVARAAGVRAVVAGRGRARQMNRGAEVTTGDPIVFLHADCRLLPAHLTELSKRLSDPGVAYGSFAIQIDAGGFAFRLIETVANWRTWMDHTPYGDQAIFIRRDAFVAVGGYRELPILEELDLSRRLKARGQHAMICEPKILTSARRWRSRGTLRTAFDNACVRVLWEFGVSPARLRSFYDRGLTHTAGGR